MKKSENTVGKQVWGSWATAGFGIAVASAFILIQILIILAFVAVNLNADPQIDMVLLIESISKNGFALAICTYATTIICTSLILLIIKFRKGATIAEYLAFRPVTPKTLLGIFALTIGCIILSDGLTLFLGKSIVPQFMVDAYRTCAYPTIFFISLVLAAPAFEEIFFRGFLLEGFRQSRIGNIGAVGLTALVWSSIHLQYGAYEIVTIFICGIILGVVRIKTGSLWSTLFMHVIWNLVATIETVLYAQGLAW